MATMCIRAIMHSNPLTALGLVWRIEELDPDSSTETILAMAQEGSDNSNAFMGSPLLFMQAAQDMAQQFMAFIGEAGNPGAAFPPAADPQALTALQQQLSLIHI